jgi:hypothetical protein
MANDEEGRFLVNVCFLDINVGIKTVLYLWQTLIHGVLFYTATMHRCALGTVHYLWRGVAPKRNVFRGKNFADPTIKKVKNLVTQPQISIKK